MCNNKSEIKYYISCCTYIFRICTFLIIYKVTPVFTSGFEKYDELNASVQENISGIRVVKAFVREEHENKKFNKAADNLYKTFVKAESFLAFNNPTMMLVVYGCIVALSWFASHFIVSGSITTGNLTSMFSYVMNMLMALMILSMIFVMVSMSAASARRISEVLNEKADLANPENLMKKWKTEESILIMLIFHTEKTVQRILYMILIFN